MSDHPPLALGGAIDPWSAVHGQPRAVAALRASAVDPVHAYLFVGPPGTGKEVAARAFAAAVLAHRRPDDAERIIRLALAGHHPDVRETRRSGAKILDEQVDEIIATAWRSPNEGDRQVLVLHEFHLLDATSAGKLLKTIEEPPPSTMFVVLADDLPGDLVTIASRCVRIDFGTIDTALIERVLADEGADPTAATAAARLANGNLDRARVLVTDPALARRIEAFASVPRRLDGTGATVARLADEMLALADEAAAVLATVHAAEVADLQARVAATGERGSGRKEMEDRHKREVRRYRTDELRSGMVVMAAAYRDAALDAAVAARAGSDPVPGDAPAAGGGVGGSRTGGTGSSTARAVRNGAARTDVYVHAVSRLHEAMDALGRNPNEALLLQALLLDLPSL